MNELIDRIVFLTQQDSKDLLERVLKGTEEMGEIAQAVLSYNKTSGCAYKNKTEDDVMEECVDLYLVIMSIMIQLQDNQFDEDKFKEMLNKKLDKWSDKIS